MSRLGVLRKYGYGTKTQKDGSSDKGLDVLTSGQFLDYLSAGRNNACTMYEGELSLDYVEVSTQNLPKGMRTLE